VVAHELGHQVHGDIWRLIGLGGALGFGSAFLASRLAPPLIGATSERTGVDDLGDEAGLPLLAIVLAAIGLVAAPLQAAFSRAIERRTDRFALELTGDGPTYASAMARLAASSLADPDPPRPVVFFLYSHPPIAERIATARRFGVATTSA
jgi:STE24 endopeptidase